MDAGKIKENIRQREIAEYVYEFIRETFEAENFNDPARFAKLLIDVITEKHLRTPDVNPGIMTVDQAKEFEKGTMPFGEFFNVKIKEVPLDRLKWYADQRFIDDLRAYLKSRIIQQETELEERYRDLHPATKTRV